MNKLVYATILVSIGAAVVVAGGPLQKTINGVDKQLSKIGNKIEVRIESMARPPPYQPSGSRGIISSAFKGAGRLLRNVAGHAGVFAKSAAGSVAQTMSESKNRILYPKPIQPPPIIQPQTIIETVEIPIPTEELQQDTNETPEVEVEEVVVEDAGQAAVEVAETTEAAEIAPEPATTEATATAAPAVATEATTVEPATTETVTEAITETVTEAATAEPDAPTEAPAASNEATTAKSD